MSAKEINKDDKFQYKGMHMIVTNTYENGDIEMMSIKLLNTLPSYKMKKEEFWKLIKNGYITFD